MAEQYGIPVILHTDHCAKKLLPWVDGLLAASERYFEKHGEPLFSSHMLDFSEEPIEENIDICKDYLARFAKIGMLLEMELGITGGEEDGVNNEDVPLEDLYSKPEEICQVYDALTPISDMFTVAAAFGNVHGVYSPGNVQLEPKILTRAQAYISEKLGDKAPADKKPVSFVFHGGSGSDVSDIQEAIGYGVIKMNVDTDTQWSYVSRSLSLIVPMISSTMMLTTNLLLFYQFHSGRVSRISSQNTTIIYKDKLEILKEMTSQTKSTMT